MASGRSTCRPGNKFLFLFSLLFVLNAIHPFSSVSESTVLQQLNLGLASSSCEDGDLVFRYGNGFWSPYFRNVSTLQKRFSHTGIVFFRNGRPWVVHSDAHSLTGVGQVRLEPLESFLADASDFAFYRLDAPQSVRKHIATVAFSYLGRPFDPSFDLHDPSKLYCSELVMHAVNEAAGKELIKPSVIHGETVVAIDDCYRNSNIREVPVLHSEAKRMETAKRL
ncbi:MAG: hypothetical protein FDX30_01165 [Chlorobium sp.]|nr:MAG: hypothetical protein FDX30_01165 [Chlorobium sp.]